MVSQHKPHCCCSKRSKVVSSPSRWNSCPFLRLFSTVGAPPPSLWNSCPFLRLFSTVGAPPDLVAVSASCCLFCFGSWSFVPVRKPPSPWEVPLLTGLLLGLLAWIPKPQLLQGSKDDLLNHGSTKHGRHMNLLCPEVAVFEQSPEHCLPRCSSIPKFRCLAT